jgi:hypothetical protein
MRASCRCTGWLAVLRATSLPRWARPRRSSGSALFAGTLLLAACGPSDEGSLEGINAGLPYFEYDHVARQPRGPRPYFSFFTTSEAGLFSLGAGRYAPAPDPVNGYGGDFGGLAGADEICTLLAQRSNPGDTKLWRAFLSTSGSSGGPRIDAIDRIGGGPWYDFERYKLADNIAGLMPSSDLEGRPRGAEPFLAAVFSDENGQDLRRDGVDNHDVLTGSDKAGRLYDDMEGGRIATCDDWTSKTLRGNPGTAFATGGQVPVGHSWPRNNAEGRHWISEHTVNGCEPGVKTTAGTAASRDDFRVGAAGGYGGFYCFALNAVPPEPVSPAP